MENKTVKSIDVSIFSEFLVSELELLYQDFGLEFPVNDGIIIRIPEVK